MSLLLANRERSGLMSPEFVDQLIQAYGAISALPPIGSIVDYKGNLPAIGGRWKNVDRSILLRASYPDLFTQIGHQAFLPGPTLSTSSPNVGDANTPGAFATFAGRPYVGMQAGTNPGLYELGGGAGYPNIYLRPGATGAGILAHPEGRVNQMAFANGYYAALRYAQTAADQLLTSGDGSTFAAYANGIMGGQYLWAIAGGAGNWIAVGSSGFIHTRAGANPAGGWDIYAPGLTGSVCEVYYDNPLALYILGCTSGNIYTSPTGLDGSWTSRMSTGQAADSIAFITRFGAYLYAWGTSTSTGIFRSSDGVTWTNVRPPDIPVIHRLYHEGTRIFAMDATNNVMYVTGDHFATYYIMPASLFPFAFGASVAPLGDPTTSTVFIGRPSGFTSARMMVPIYFYVTHFALPAPEPGRKQIIRVL